ncbi:MAG: UDP-N-acetylmuramate--L-alanine ligase [Candidatus Omnitrophota bacterium]
MRESYHFIGIGGIGMSGIARLMLKCGFSVSGSDLREGRITKELEGLGARICIGHSPGNIKGMETVVYSSAISDDNPEMVHARDKGLPLMRRAEALAMLMRSKRVITVSGSHGKTTTTSLVSCILLEAGLHPSVAIGGVLKNIDSNACAGKGDFFVAEADESDGSFLYYKPEYSIITNVDREHLDHYRTFENELGVFGDFLEHTLPGGCVFACYDDSNLRRLCSDYGGRTVFFGLEDGSDISAKNIEQDGFSSSFDCFAWGKFVFRLRLPLGGRHNISNSLGAIGLGLELGIDPACIRRSLEGYKGAGRRLDVKFKSDKYMVLDDYAHHPTEIKATLDALDKAWAGRKVVVFQPHRYSRTQLLMDEFAHSFDRADILVVTDVYAAGERPIEGVDAHVFLERLKKTNPGKPVFYTPREKAEDFIMDCLRPGDMAVILGAGDIVKVSDDLAERFKQEN